MQCSTLVRRAAKCKTREEAQDFAAILAQAFLKTRALRGLEYLTNNDEGTIDSDGQLYAKIDLVHLPSGHFAISVAPEIREGKLGLSVNTLHLKDGFGLHSQDWETFGDLEEWLEAEEGESIAQLARRAKEEALRQHAVLLTEVGLMPPAAIAAAAKSWPKS